MAPGLEFVERIEFDVNGETKSVELHYGDITQIAVSAMGRIDILMISAYYGDYTPTPGSLIGALYRNLQLNVRQLAKEFKEVDLRRLFYCWWTKPLPSTLPFRRILCFESSHSGSSPQKAVQAIFKALLAASGLFTNGTVLAPLLSTGDQGHSTTKMLKAMVNNCVTWMSNGLDIKNFKLVVYRGDEHIRSTFLELKEMHEKQARVPGATSGAGAPVKKVYDFYISASEDNEQQVKQVKDVFLKHNPKFKFYLAKGHSEDADEVVFNVMKSCCQVLTFLSPTYLANDDCMNQYNAAWCLNKNMAAGTHLVPLLCEKVADIPTYMSLVQWIDIRIKDKGTEKVMMNISLYITNLTEYGSEDVMTAKRSIENYKSSHDEKGKVVATVKRHSHKYDIFISYAHADSEAVNYIIKTLTDDIPDVKLFVDRQELHTGGSWQQTLYHALENSYITLACLSPHYIQSKMCIEEFRLSLARHFSVHRFQLVPIEISECGPDLPDTYTCIRNIALPHTSSLEEYVKTVLSPGLKRFLHEGNSNGTLIPFNKRNFELSEMLEDGRGVMIDSLISSQPVCTSSVGLSSKCVEILVSNADDEVELAHQIKNRLLAHGLLVEVTADLKDPASVLKRLDDADLIVALISASFIRNDNLTEALHVAINRQRYCKDRATKFYPVLLTNDLDTVEDKYHVYYELLRYEISLADHFYDSWRLEKAMKNHPDYQYAIEECEKIAKETENKADGIEEPGTMLKQKLIKFLAIIVNRILYHLTHQDGAHEVLRDVFEYIRELVSEDSLLNRMRESAAEKLKSGQTTVTELIEKQSAAVTTQVQQQVDSLKDTASRHSQICNLL